MDILFKNCSIVTEDANGLFVIKNGYLGVKGEYISHVGTAAPKERCFVERDMAGAVLIPGLVNAHGHAPMTLLRGAGCGLPLQRWLSEAIFPVEAKLTPSDIEIGAKAAMLEMLACGTTCYSEMYDFPFAEAKSAAECGIKVNLSRVGLCFNPDFDKNTDERFSECIDFVRIMRGEADGNAEFMRETGGHFDAVSDAVKKGRIVPELCLHSEYLTTENFVRAIADAAKELKTGINIHVSETKKEHDECILRHGKTPAEYLYACGIMDSPCTFAHCVWVTDTDLDLMKEKGASLVNNPSSNMKLGSGFAPVKAALKKGVNLAIGTDGCASNNILNMFSELRLSALAASGGSLDPAAVRPSDILRAAALGGAFALGRGDTGSLKPGMKADIAAVSMDAPHMKPDIDTLSTLCYCAQGSDVIMTMADGKILYDRGEYTTLDKEKILYELEKTVENLYIRV